MRKGQTLVGTYNNRNLVTQFQIFHCRDSLNGQSACVDAVCGMCKLDSENDRHSCPNCDENIKDYKLEENEAMLPRCRPEWGGVGPESCAICAIII